MESYKDMDEVLQEISASKVKLSKDAVDKNNLLLSEVLNELVCEMKKDAFFNELYTEYFYGGSYYEGLKVGAPDEYDIDLKFNLHRTCKPELIESPEFQGFVSVKVNLNEINSQPNLSIYKKLKQFLDDDRLDASRLRSWFEGLLTKTIRALCIPEVKKFTKSGPAMTLHIETEYTTFAVDLVPCFYLGKSLWPSGFQTFDTNDNFFIIPKSPNEDRSDLWRLSFQIQEGIIIKDKGNLKPTLRLLKVLRDSEKTLLPIKSYFIKTIFLWKLQEDPNYFQNRSLYECFMEMLKLLYTRINEQNVVYYWNPDFNLFVKHDIYLKDVTNLLSKKIAKLENNDSPDVLRKMLEKTPNQQVQVQIQGLQYGNWNYNTGDTSDEDEAPPPVGHQFGNWNYHSGDTSDEDEALPPVEWQHEPQVQQVQEQPVHWGWWAGAAAVGVGAIGAALFANARQNRNRNNN